METQSFRNKNLVLQYEESKGDGLNHFTRG